MKLIMKTNEYSDLKLLNIRKTNKVYSIDEIKNISKKVFEKYKIDKVYLFGSYSRGEATGKSDIDIMTVGGELNTLESLSTFALELVKLFKKEFDIVSEEKYTKTQKNNKYFELANQLFYKEVCRERVLIYG